MREIPRLRFASLPTPIHRLDRITQKFTSPEIFIKRDDLTGLAFGGNKTRKLEFLVAEARANGAKTLVTAGAIQSNHCRQTAAAAARYGLDCILVLSKPVFTNEDRLQEDVISGNYFLNTLLNAEIVLVDKEQRTETLQEVYAKAWKNGKRPYAIPYGGSNPTGACAYAFALEEVLHQGLKPDCILVGSSSGGTQAGLVAGADILGYRGSILGISIDEEAQVMKSKIASLSTETADLLGSRQIFQPKEIEVIDDYLGDGYGICGEAEREAILLFSRLEGIFLDPVYTGRAAAGLIDLVHKDYFQARKINSVLFWHTGGTPALFTGYYSRYLAG